MNTSTNDDLIIVDGTCPLLYDRKYTTEYQKGKVTVAIPTVQNAGGTVATLKEIGAWHRRIADDKTLKLVRTAADVHDAKANGQLGLVLHFQGADPLEDKVDLIDAFKAAGVSMIQLTYNVKNRLGDGCEERTDAGLSKFGVACIKRMNKVGVIVDLSHTGRRTTYEAMEVSESPAIISHACVKAVYDSDRNLIDDQIKAIAQQGGIVGVAAVPFFISAKKRPAMSDFLAHIKYIANLVGVDHVALGMDYYTGQHPYMPDDQAIAVYNGHLTSGRWSPENYPPPPYYYPEGIETPATFPVLATALREDGFSAQEVEKIMGGNWVRIFENVLK